MKKSKNNINFMKTKPFSMKTKVKPINFMRAKPMPKPRPLKNTKYNNAPLKGLNIVNVRSKNIYNISPNAPPRPNRRLVPVPTMIRKESTKQSSPLSKWGDADMDGTVNFLDCSPRNVADDGFFGDMIDKVKGVFKKKTPEVTVSDEVIDDVKTRLTVEAVKSELAPTPKAVGVIEAKKEGLKEIRAQAEKAVKDIKKEYKKQIDNKNKLKYSKHKMEGQRKFSRGVLNLVETMVPGKVAGARAVYGSKSASKAGPKRPVGRPKGSYKHVIPGKGLVSGDDYDRWERIQRMKGQVGMVGGPKPILRTEQIQRVVEADGMPQQSSEERFARERQVAIQQAQSGAVTMPQKGLSRDPYKAAIQQRQMQEQMNDNVLNVERLEAPNIMKGEMVDTGAEDNILNAPNINHGEMRNVTGEERVGVELGERPQTNPYGDEYLEIEPGSGKAYIKRRINEKWATGEAL